MPYPDKLLADDEKVVEHLHPHWITLVPATLWFLVVCGAAGFGIGYAPSSGTAHSVVVGLILVVALVLVFKFSVGPLITWASSHYVFTTHRVLIRRGVLRHTGRDIGLQRISDVAFSQTLFDRIVRAGTLTIESAGEHGQETLTNVPRSDRQQQLLNRLIEEDHDRRAARYGGMGQQYGARPPYPGQGYPTTPGPTGYPPQYPTTQYPPQ